jgi:hypothetical protein
MVQIVRVNVGDSHWGVGGGQRAEQMLIIIITVIIVIQFCDAVC